MRVCLLSLVLAIALMPAQTVSSQGMQLKTPNPDATAFDADWQVNNEPIVASGLTYYPTRETRMFDGQVMTQVDVYKGVPVYADMSIAPFTLVYVPLTPSRMRTYERPADGDRRVITGRGQVDPTPVATTGSAEAAPLIIVPPIVPRPAGRVETLRRPRGTAGVWVEFDGVRWFHDGSAQSFRPDRFARAGDYHGFTVYREQGTGADRIWIATVPGGPLTPYKRR